jgi:hypothetical protein
LAWRNTFTLQVPHSRTVAEWEDDQVTEVKPKPVTLKLEPEDAQKLMDFLGEYRAIIGGMGFAAKHEEAVRLTNLIARAAKK